MALRKNKTPKRQRRRKRRSPVAPSQAQIWSQSLRRFHGVAHRGGDILRGAIAFTGRRLLAGGFENAPAPAKKIDPLLAAIEAAPAVRRAVGRLDISGAQDAAAWARLAPSAWGAELTLFYRFGRAVTQDLAAAAEAIFAEQNLRVVRQASPVLRSRPGGAWAAVFQLAPARVSAPPRRGPIMAR